VDKYIQKMTYERIAWKTAGVIEVDNEIRVTPVKPLTDAAIKRKIKEIVQTYRQFQGVNISVSVSAGVVDVLISLNQPADILFLKRKIAAIDGVVSIDIMAKFMAVIPPAPLLDGAVPLADQTQYSGARPA
jgi:osmotically-inducible protein OsmY